MDDRYQRIVEALQRPETYAREAIDIRGPIEIVETHVSHLFLTGGYVYKVKKPVDLGFVDLTTLERRKANCEREIALNRRFSPGVYLDVLPLVQAGDGFEVGGEGEAVDYVVKMRQLPRDRILDALLERNAVSEADVRAVAKRIAEFHATAARSAGITRVGGRQGVRRHVDENFEQTARYVGQDLSRAAYEDIVAYNEAFLGVRDGLLRQREDEGRIVDGHGDLHAAQICVLEATGDDRGRAGTPSSFPFVRGRTGRERRIEFIDCIEFSEAYRYGDVALDLAFLAMDLDHFGRPDLSEALVDAYVEASGDEGVRGVLPFHECYRAYVRGKVASLTVDTAKMTKTARQATQAKAASYYELARGYALGALPRRNVYAVMGLSGTGKSTLGRAIAEHWGAPRYSSDVERKRIAAAGFARQQFWGAGEGLYSKDMDRRTYEALFEAGERALATGSIVLDATFRDEAMRRRVIELAAANDAQAWFVECMLADAEVHRRLDARAAEGRDPSDATWEVYLDQRRGWHGVGDVSPAWHVAIDTAAPPDEVLRRALRSLFERALRG